MGDRVGDPERVFTKERFGAFDTEHGAVVSVAGVDGGEGLGGADEGCGSALGGDLAGVAEDGLVFLFGVCGDIDEEAWGKGVPHGVEEDL